MRSEAVELGTPAAGGAARAGLGWPNAMRGVGHRGRGRQKRAHTSIVATGAQLTTRLDAFHRAKRHANHRGTQQCEGQTPLSAATPHPAPRRGDTSPLVRRLCAPPSGSIVNPALKARFGCRVPRPLPPPCHRSSRRRLPHRSPRTQRIWCAGKSRRPRANRACSWVSSLSCTGGVPRLPQAILQDACADG